MGVFSGVARVINSLFIETESQFVSDDDDKNLEGTLVRSVKEGNFPKEDAKQLIETYMLSVIKKAENLSKRIENSVPLLPSDKSDFRNDSTVEKASIYVETKPAGELENHRRTPGGRGRGQK